MQNINKFSIFTLTILAFLISVTESRASVSCSTTDCEALGYTMNASTCSGVAMVKCPFDETKVVCRPKVDTPIFNIVKEAMGSYCTLPDDFNLHSDMFGDCFDLEGEYICYELESIFYGKNVDFSCEDADYGYDFWYYSTPQEVVTYVENQLMKYEDPCEGYVTFDSSIEKCTSYCSADSSKCMTKKYITCDEAISAAGGTKLSSSTTSTTSISNMKYYLTTNVTFTGTINNASPFYIYSAASLPPCKRELGLSIEDTSVTFKSLSYYNSYATRIANFYLPTTIEYLNVYMGSINFNFFDTSDVYVSLTPQTNYNPDLSFYYGTMSGSTLDSKLSVYCSDDNYDYEYNGYNYNQCNIEVEVNNQYLNYCISTYNAEENFTCIDDVGSGGCSEDWEVCEYY